MDQADANVLHEERDRMQSECLKAVFATYFRILKLRTPHLMGAVLEVREFSTPRDGRHANENRVLLNSAISSISNSSVIFSKR